MHMTLPRTILERLSRNRILKRRLPADFSHAPILVSPDACLAHWKTRISSDLFDYAREFVKPESVVWDIGANVGLFTVAAARRSGSKGRVIAVEADIWLAGVLRKSAALQSADCAPIQVIPAAAFSSIGLAEFHIARRGRASNHLSHTRGSSQTGGIREKVSVVTLTLDWLLEQGAAPNVIKIDVEGAEWNVLKGATRVLTEARPVLLCEALEHIAEITELLLDHGYMLFDWESNPRKMVANASFNTLAIPR